MSACKCRALGWLMETTHTGGCKQARGLKLAAPRRIIINLQAGTSSTSPSMPTNQDLRPFACT